MRFRYVFLWWFVCGVVLQSSFWYGFVFSFYFDSHKREFDVGQSCDCCVFEVLLDFLERSWEQISESYHNCIISVPTRARLKSFQNHPSRNQPKACRGAGCNPPDTPKSCSVPKPYQNHTKLRWKSQSQIQSVLEAYLEIISKTFKNIIKRTHCFLNLVSGNFDVIRLTTLDMNFPGNRISKKLDRWPHSLGMSSSAESALWHQFAFAVTRSTNSHWDMATCLGNRSDWKGIRLLKMPRYKAKSWTLNTQNAPVSPKCCFVSSKSLFVFALHV